MVADALAAQVPTIFVSPVTTCTLPAMRAHPLGQDAVRVVYLGRVVYAVPHP